MTTVEPREYTALTKSIASSGLFDNGKVRFLQCLDSYRMLLDCAMWGADMNMNMLLTVWRQRFLKDTVLVSIPESIVDMYCPLSQTIA
jgi:hypothetical protein